MATSALPAKIPIRGIRASAYTIPTDFPEADGTYAWDKTTLVIAEAEAGGLRGLGYSYANAATAKLIADSLADLVKGRDALDISGCWIAMVQGIRNLGRPGVCSMAIAALDMALWDLKARLLNVPLLKLLGAVREAVAVYGSGGFTSYSDQQLQAQFRNWVSEGISRVKMKIGSDPDADPGRVRAAREAIGPDVQLFVDANGAYTRKQALGKAARFADLGVVWFEEPVSSDDLEGLRLIRDSGPPGMDIAAGEYGYDLPYFRRMLDAGAVDVLQADATRCAGPTGFLKAAALCESRSMPLSAHTGPTIHGHLCCAVGPAQHVEYFHDHVRIERMLFDGALKNQNGSLRPDLSRPGLGFEFKTADAQKYRVL